MHGSHGRLTNQSASFAVCRTWAVDEIWNRCYFFACDLLLTTSSCTSSLLSGFVTGASRVRVGPCVGSVGMICDWLRLVGLVMLAALSRKLLSHGLDSARASPHVGNEY